MPQLVTLRVDRATRRPVRVWVPILPVALVLGPLLILATAVACLLFRVRVMRAIATGWRLFCALPGTRFDVHEGRTGFLVSIR